MIFKTSTITFLLLPLALLAQEDPHKGNWLHWRGPLQTGVSLEQYENGKFNPEPAWTREIAGRGTPVIHDGQMYSWGYRGSGPDLEEVLSALDPLTGKVIWERTFSDFISDTVYDRYAIGAPVVDPETGNIFLHTTYGLLNCHDRDGNLLWEISMMERFGRLTFPNGRAGSCVIVDDLLITRAVTSYWGADGPARDRFFGFDKNTGELVWSSTPGVGPPFLKDTSFSSPVVTVRNGRQVFYAGTGCGNLVCVNLADGKPLWRYQMSMGGINSSVLIHGDKLIGVHGKENLDTTEIGRMFALNLPSDDANSGGVVDPMQKGAPRIEEGVERWRQPFGMFTSSPVLVGDRVYQVSHEGELFCMVADTGEILWHEKLDTGQLHASPAYVDGLLIVPMNLEKLFVIRPSDEGPEILHKIPMEGNCLGSPAVCNGWVYVHTMSKLYAFKFENDGITWGDLPKSEPIVKGPVTGIRAVPSDVLLEPGDKVDFLITSVDANGNAVGEVSSATWEKFIPPTAKVKAKLDADFDDQGVLVATESASESAGMFKGTADGKSGFVRGRVIEALPISEDFESYDLTVDHAEGFKFSFPPLPWIGARLKWEVRDLDGNKVLAKTLDNILFQRCQSFIGHPDSSNYTIQADLMTDGNRRVKSTVGLINQRYNCSLIGNSNLLEVSSNHERVKQSVSFPIKANSWYTLKMRVDLNDDGSGVVRAKAWEKGTGEPDTWTIEVEHKKAHKKGAPGLFGFSPQSQKSVFIDNIEITQN
tara:strand:- start:18632 stop:20911 length:2280 start_codon:yes stop_codon:yes gene_type:complete